jgi:hypothetical protein
MFGIQPLRTNQTVPVSTENDGNEEKNNEHESGAENKKKRTWTPAREAAWEKCLEGRKRYVETKKEITAKEEEDRRLKEKIRVEMIKKQIRAEIEAELRADKENHDIDISDVCENSGEEKKEKPIEKKTVPTEERHSRDEKKRKKVRVHYESSSTESSTEIDSEEERKLRRKRKLKKKLRKSKKKAYSSSTDSSSDEENDQDKFPVKHTKHIRQPPSTYMKTFSFV